MDVSSVFSCLFLQEKKKKNMANNWFGERQAKKQIGAIFN